jgi:hypothetical protein
MSSYWVVSPNLASEIKGALVAWKKIVRQKHVAVMGWSKKHKIGRRFVDEIADKDVILIARRHRGKPEIVGFGIVRGNAVPCGDRNKAKSFIKGMEAPRHFGFFRNLSPFVRCNSSPERIPLIKALGHTMALARLHPKRNHAHKLVCDWMNKSLLGSDSRRPDELMSRKVSVSQVASGKVRLVSLPKNHDFDYKFRSKRRIIRARKEEAELLEVYRGWIEAKYGRTPCAIRIGQLICDCFEKERCNLIEAKSSISREHMRMAVGQLLDYGFHAEKEFGKPNLGILLPEKPARKSLKWVRRLNIGIIWRNKGGFQDYEHGKFT